MIRVALIDAHALFRSGLRALIATAGDIDVVGEAGSAADGLSLIAGCMPDVAIIDGTLPDASGPGLCAAARALYPTVGCIILTADASHEALLAAIVAEAAAFLPKTPRGDGIIDAVRDVAAGRVIIGNALNPPPRTHPPRRRQSNGRHR